MWRADTGSRRCRHNALSNLACNRYQVRVVYIGYLCQYRAVQLRRQTADRGAFAAARHDSLPATIVLLYYYFIYITRPATTVAAAGDLRGQNHDVFKFCILHSAYHQSMFQDRSKWPTSRQAITEPTAHQAGRHHKNNCTNILKLLLAIKLLELLEPK